MPDFDVDFCMNRRDEVIKYVKEKYGKNNVGQIVTMHQIKARSGVIRDIARAMEIPFAEADKLAKFVPEPVQGKSPPIARRSRRSRGSRRSTTRARSTASCSTSRRGSRA